MSWHRGGIFREEGVTEETVASFGITGGGSMHYEARFKGLLRKLAIMVWSTVARVSGRDPSP